MHKKQKSFLFFSDKRIPSRFSSRVSQVIERGEGNRLIGLDDKSRRRRKRRKRRRSPRNALQIGRIF